MSGIYMQSGGSVERDTTLRDLLAVIFKYKWMILAIVGVVSGFVAFKTLTSPATFTADATILLDRQGARASLLENSGRSLPWVEVVDSEVQVLQSTPVLQGALAKLKEDSPELAAGLTLGQMSRSIKTGVIEESNVIYVSATTRSAERSVAIANAVAESYRNYYAEIYQIPDPSGFITERAQALYEELADLQAKRAETYASVGLTDVDEVQDSLIRERSQQRKALSELDVQIVRLENDTKSARANMDAGIMRLPYVENTGSYQGHNMSQVQRDFEMSQASLEQLRLKYTELHPEVVEARDRVESLRTLLRSWVEMNVEMREHELETKRAERAELVRSIEALDEDLARLPELNRELGLLDAKIKTVTSQYTEMSDHIVDTAVSGASYRDSGAKLLSPAVGSRRNKKGDPVRMALGPILALLAGIGLAFYLENLDHSLRNREDVEQHLEIPVLASFPEVRVDESPGTSGSSRIPFQSKGRS